MDKKKALIISIIFFIGGVGAFFYIKMRRKKKYALLDSESTSTGGGSSTSSQIQATFNAEPYAKNLQIAMKGWGTDEDAIWESLEQLSAGQRKQVENYFNSNFGDGSTLKEWFEGDLQGDDLKRALAYLN